MKFYKLYLTEKQMDILDGQAVQNTILSLLEYNDYTYDKKAIKQLSNKISKLYRQRRKKWLSKQITLEILLKCTIS